MAEKAASRWVVWKSEPVYPRVLLCHEDFGVHSGGRCLELLLALRFLLRLLRRLLAVFLLLRALRLRATIDLTVHAPTLSPRRA